MTICLGCSRFWTSKEFVVDGITFKNENAFESFAESHPDSALQLLKHDLQIPEKDNIKTANIKILLCNECSLQHFQKIDNDSLLQKASAYFDSVFAADYAEQKSLTEDLLQIQQYRIRAYYLMGCVDQQNYNFTNAINHYIEALRIVDEYFKENPTAISNNIYCNIHLKISDIFFYTDHFDICKSICFTIYDFAKSVNDSLLIAKACFGVGRICNHLARMEGNNDTAFVFLKRGLNYVDEAHHPFEKAQLLGCLGDCYRFCRKRDSAIICFQQAILMMPPENEAIYKLYNREGYVYFLKQEYDSALQLISKVLETNDFYQKRSAIWGLADIYKKIGNEKESAYFSDLQREYQVKADLIKKQNADAQALFEHYQMEQLTQKFSKKTHSLLLFFVVIGIVIVITTAVLWIRYRLKIKQHQEKQQQSEQEKEHLAAALHSTQHQLEDHQKHIEEADLKKNKEQLFQQQWQQFIETEIYQTIIHRCPGNLTEERMLFENHSLSTAEWDELIFVLDRLFNHFSQTLHAQYPDLTKAELHYCFLSVFSLKEIEKAALSGISYQGLGSRRFRVSKKIDCEVGSLTDFFKNLMKENIC